MFVSARGGLKGLSFASYRAAGDKGRLLKFVTPINQSSLALAFLSFFLFLPEKCVLNTEIGGAKGERRESNVSFVFCREVFRPRFIQNPTHPKKIHSY